MSISTEPTNSSLTDHSEHVSLKVRVEQPRAPQERPTPSGFELFDNRHQMRKKVRRLSNDDEKKKGGVLREAYKKKEKNHNSNSDDFERRVK